MNATIKFVIFYLLLIIVKCYVNKYNDLWFFYNLVNDVSLRCEVGEVMLLLKGRLLQRSNIQEKSYQPGPVSLRLITPLVLSQTNILSQELFKYH